MRRRCAACRCSRRRPALAALTAASLPPAARAARGSGRLLSCGPRLFVSPSSACFRHLEPLESTTAHRGDTFRRRTFARARVLASREILPIAASLRRRDEVQVVLAGAPTSPTLPSRPCVLRYGRLLGARNAGFRYSRRQSLSIPISRRNDSSGFRLPRRPPSIVVHRNRHARRVVNRRRAHNRPIARRSSMEAARTIHFAPSWPDLSVSSLILAWGVSVRPNADSFVLEREYLYMRAPGGGNPESLRGASLPRSSLEVTNLNTAVRLGEPEERADVCPADSASNF